MCLETSDGIRNMTNHLIKERGPWREVPFSTIPRLHDNISGLDMPEYGLWGKQRNQTL